MCDDDFDIYLTDFNNDDIIHELRNRNLTAEQKDLIFKTWMGSLSLLDQQKHELVRDFIDQFSWEELDSIFSFAKVFRKLK